MIRRQIAVVLSLAALAGAAAACGGDSSTAAAQVETTAPARSLNPAVSLCAQSDSRSFSCQKLSVVPSSFLV